MVKEQVKIGALIQNRMTRITYVIRAIRWKQAVLQHVDANKPSGTWKTKIRSLRTIRRDYDLVEAA